MKTFSGQSESIPFNPVIGSNFKVKQDKRNENKVLINHSQIILDWQAYIVLNKEAKVDFPVSLSFTKSGIIKIGFSYSDVIKEFNLLDEALRYINNFITS